MASRVRVLAVLSMPLVLAAAPRPAAAGEPPAIVLKTGLSVANVYGDHSSLFSPQWKLGVGGGVSMRFPLGSGFSIQPEVLYIMKGSSYGQSEATDAAGNSLGAFETLRAVDYLEIPVLAAQRLGGGGVAFQLAAGPALAFKVRERFVTSAPTATSTNTNEFSSVDVGAVFGAGFVLGRGTNRLSVDGRFTLGLTKLSDRMSDRNRDLLFMAGIVHRLGGEE